MIKYTEEKFKELLWARGKEKIELSSMDEEYLRNVLRMIYNKRDYLWIWCRDVRLIKKYPNPDIFYTRYLTKTPFFKALLKEITKRSEEELN
ncbi:hypothetical protein BACPU_26140 [Bacillus pumilus]|nr:hypothetical protein BACPU_26140 [Bacillus pumilus]